MYIKLNGPNAHKALNGPNALNGLRVHKTYAGIIDSGISYLFLIIMIYKPIIFITIIIYSLILLNAFQKF